jgi:hypothetical protein
MSYPHWPKDPQPRPRRRHERSITKDDVQDWLFLLLLAAFAYVSMFAFGGVE